jgi:hypothetical protein
MSKPLPFGQIEVPPLLGALTGNQNAACIL